MTAPILASSFPGALRWGAHEDLFLTWEPARSEGAPDPGPPCGGQGWGTLPACLTEEHSEPLLSVQAPGGPLGLEGH